MVLCTYLCSRICLDPVGVIHSPYREKGDAPHQVRGSDAVSAIEIYPRFIPGLGTMAGIRNMGHVLDGSGRTKSPFRMSL